MNQKIKAGSQLGKEDGRTFLLYLMVGITFSSDKYNDKYH